MKFENVLLAALLALPLVACEASGTLSLDDDDASADDDDATDDDDAADDDDATDDDDDATPEQSPWTGDWAGSMTLTGEGWNGGKQEYCSGEFAAEVTVDGDLTGSSECTLAFGGGGGIVFELDGEVADKGSAAGDYTEYFTWSPDNRDNGRFEGEVEDGEQLVMWWTGEVRFGGGGGAVEYEAFAELSRK